MSFCPGANAVALSFCPGANAVALSCCREGEPGDAAGEVSPGL